MTDSFGNIIGGVRAPAASGEVFESRNPANPSEVVGVFARSGPADGAAAVQAAHAAAADWAATPAPTRAQILERAVAILNERTTELGTAITNEMGKLLDEAIGYDVGGAAKQGNYMIGEARRMFGMTVPSEMTDKFACTIREPIGVVSVITPWNLPMLTPAAKIFAALVCGNTVVFKPSEETAWSGYLLYEVFEEAGLPAGVLNLVTGYGAEVGDVLLTAPEVAMVSFTGSTATGRHIGGAAGALTKKLSLEMGGKNAIVVMDDADLSLAVEGALWGGFGTSGQRCTASSRLILHEKIHDEFVEAYLAAMQGLRVGNPLDPATQLGPLVNQKAIDKVHRYTQIGVDEGAKLLTGGNKLDLDGGYYYAPTLFTDVEPTMRIAQEEIFGPTVAVMRASNFNEAIELANGTDFGLSLSIYTQRIDQGFKAARSFKSGLAYVNAPTIGSEMHLPFGGAKATGNGTREYSQSAIEDYTEVKTLFIDYGGAMRRSGIDD
ncbi:MAG: aldehyde dehydrogenase family protein [Beutenbergiaceae bacterium]